LTDVNLLLGLLDPQRFGIPVDPDAAEAAFAGVAAAVRAGAADASRDALRRDALLAGFRAIADERMAEAIRSISVRRGYDPADYALLAFGGAGGQHACAVAALLGVGTVLVPPDAGLLSALGLGHAVVERFAQRQVLRPLAEVGGGELAALLDELAAQAATAVTEGTAVAGAVVEGAVAAIRDGGGAGRPPGTRAAVAGRTDRRGEPAAAATRRPPVPARDTGRNDEGERSKSAPAAGLEVRRRILHLRFAGQESTLAVEPASGRGGALSTQAVRAAFGDAYRARYGYLPEDRPLEVESVRVAVSTPREEEAPGGEPPAERRPVPVAVRRAHLGGCWREAAVHERTALLAGDRFSGPALVFEAHGATAVEPGWCGEVDAVGTLVLRRSAPGDG